MLGFIILSFSVLNPVSVFASQSSVSQPVPVVKRRRGRPPGSKNKPKELDEVSRPSSSVLPSSIPPVKKARGRGRGRGRGRVPLSWIDESEAMRADSVEEINVSVER